MAYRVFNFIISILYSTDNILKGLSMSVSDQCNSLDLISQVVYLAVHPGAQPPSK
jgi:hypothetical protein